MDTGTNPTKSLGSEKFLYPLQVMLDGWRKVDPPTMKKLPIEVDIPELLANLGRKPDASPKDKAVGELTLIAFYYLLRVGEYTCKGTRNETKQTVQFRICDVTFFKFDEADDCLKQLPRDASDEDILSADGATLMLANQKNGWKGVCIHHHANGDDFLCPVRALGRRIVEIRQHTTNMSTNLSAFWTHGKRSDVTDVHIRQSLKWAAEQLKYPERGIPIERIDTHSLRAGGANALHLCGYEDREIQKMGRWRGETFKEYISDCLRGFSEGMSKDMRKKFNFVNIEGGVWHDVTSTTINSPYSINAKAA